MLVALEKTDVQDEVGCIGKKRRAGLYRFCWKKSVLQGYADCIGKKTDGQEDVGCTKKMRREGGNCFIGKNVTGQKCSKVFDLLRKKLTGGKG